VLVNWDGEVIDETWFTREAFTIGDVVITNEELTHVLSITLIIVVIILALLVCMWKRKPIVNEARRASE
jgi:hypothetical protein